ncbi:MAG: DUF2797 domain-containing protein [Halodesulfurarchaeum sp.]
MQIVGYEAGTTDAPAGLLLAENGSVRREELERESVLRYDLHDRHCAGEVLDDRHLSCDRSAAPYCDRHETTWPCAVCRGDCAMPLETCHEEHVVYLAAFEPRTFKVGVTRTWRLRDRLLEQGAARGVRLRTVRNGRLARQIEADIATDLTDRVSFGTKIDGLAASLDEAAWEHLLSKYDPSERYHFEYGLELSHRPIEATMATGRVLGTRGRILVLERDATAYAVDLRKLVGFEYTIGTDEGNRQVSLGTYGQ